VSGSVSLLAWALHSRLRPSLFSRTYISLAFVEAVLSCHLVTVVVIGAMHTPLSESMYSYMISTYGNVWNCRVYGPVTRRRRTDSSFGG
jgi:hypothetical protein